ncbi:MAG TPA: 2-oxo-4-hydroxy-4-carboxy-5-ureidoimidazoline decarboxylase [Burkholderiales bacterium]|nr:2-oxo-4-hydroxy-4-carboxy-5-ureidoimidazoline decarboxylase [Burkholderiales bacterium]
MALEEVNALGREEFVARLGGVFERSAWVAERAWYKRPFRSIDELHRAMLGAVASHEAKLELARAHPELAGREALTVASGSEQARLGFNALSRNELEEMNRLNRRYRDRFGFPCIVALRLHADRQSVVTEIRRRLANDADSELRNALEQIGHITRGRLERIFDG